jgi:excinuclease UvrABC nuclease subunit
MWQGEGYAFDRHTITTVVDHSPGIYVLWNAEQWIYVGESQDLRESLLTHLNGGDPRIAARSPGAFGFELHRSREGAAARCHELVRALEPLCNVTHRTVPRLATRAHHARRLHLHSRFKNQA